jgi:hypothetical protein
MRRERYTPSCDGDTGKARTLSQITYGTGYDSGLKTGGYFGMPTAPTS